MPRFDRMQSERLMVSDNMVDRRILLGAATLIAVGGATSIAAKPKSKAAAPEIWQQVNTVLQDYADSLDRCDPEAFGAVFTADGVFDYKPDMVIKGRPALVAAARMIFAGVTRSSHHVGPPVVTPGEKAGQWRARSYFSAHHLLTTGKRLTLHGRYEDVFALEGGVLLIAYRKVIGHIAEDGMETESRYWLRPYPAKKA